jgi:protein O-GlcNAc transferase
MAFARNKSKSNTSTPLAIVIESRDSLPTVERIIQPKDVSTQPLSTIPYRKREFHFFLIITMLLLIPLNARAQKVSPDQRLENAATFIRDNRLAEAEQELANLLKVAPKEAQALNLLGTIRASQGRLGEAEILFVRALRINNQLVGAHMNLAYLYLLKGAPEKTISELKVVLTLTPNNTEALYKLARLLLSQGRFDEGISLIEKSKAEPRTTVAFFVLLGEAYLSKGNTEKAEENYLLALGKQGDAMDALLGIVQVSQSRGDARTASLYLSRAREQIGTSPELHYKFALITLKSGIYEEAKSALEQAIKLRPNEPTYFLALGATLLKKPDLYEAEQAFRRALKLQPDSSQGQMYLGYTLLKQKQYSEARIYLEKSVKADAGIPEPLYYLGILAKEQNEDQRAVEILERVVRRFPGFANAHLALGSSYMKLKNYQRAKQELELAVKLDPNEPKAHYNLALLYARLNDPQRAQQEMQIVERLKSRNGQSNDNDVSPPSSPRPH